MSELKNKKLFLFDIDGTIAVGNTLFEGSRELLSYISSIGGASYFITNNSTKSNSDYVDKFKNIFSIDTTENLFVTSGYMTIQYLKKHYGKSKIYVQGTTSFLQELRKNNLNIVDAFSSDLACAVVAFDNELTYQKLSETCKVLSLLDLPFYGTNPDLCCPVDFGFIPDCGAICNMITFSTNKEPIYLGKPNKEVVLHCIKDSGFSLKETLVIGDRLYTDIACGMNAEVDTCLLFTGEAKKEDVNNTRFKPTYSFENVQELLQNLK